MFKYNKFVQLNTLKKAIKIMKFNAMHYDQYLVVDMPNGHTYMYPNTNYNRNVLKRSGRTFDEIHANMN